MATTVDLDKLTLQAHADYKMELGELLNLLGDSIDNKIPKARDFLPKHQNRITRPTNSNIIYTNLLNKLGLLEIAREFCESNEINICFQSQIDSAVFCGRKYRMVVRNFS